jgi:hypothetical protein
MQAQTDPGPMLSLSVDRPTNDHQPDGCIFIGVVIALSVDSQ